MATETLRPGSDGDYYPPTDYFTPVGSASCYDAVNEPSPDDDSKYIEGYELSGYGTFYISANSIPVGSTITNVEVFVRAKYVPGSLIITRNMYILIVSGGGDFSQTGGTLTTSYVNYSASWANDPSGGAWTISDITNLQIGLTYILESAGNDNTIRVTQIYCVVTYTPPGGGGSVQQKIVMPRQAINRASTY